MNHDLTRLQPYPFEKLASLKRDLTPPADLEPVALSIGEPRHAPPHFVIENLIAHLHQLSVYPSTRGTDSLRETIAGWLARRFRIAEHLLDPARHVLPVCGTREALFAIAQTVVERGDGTPLVMMPNPFYQIYEGAALLAGATPRYLDCLPENDFLPNLEAVDPAAWANCQLIYICSPANPSGAVMPAGYLARLIELAERHDFVIASDECYSEIYYDESAPPPGLLGVAAAIGNDRFERCLAFHSLSKRSNLPGLRSGFVAGDADLIGAFLRYRTYQGCSMPPPTQSASIAAWGDEKHVVANRVLYREKFDRVAAALAETLAPRIPAAGFYLWPQTPIADDAFARKLYAEQNLTVLPGSYLSRDVGGRNPGAGRIRMALVASLEECLDAAGRINSVISALQE